MEWLEYSTTSAGSFVVFSSSSFQSKTPPGWTSLCEAHLCVTTIPGILNIPGLYWLFSGILKAWACWINKNSNCLTFSVVSTLFFIYASVWLGGGGGGD